MLLLLLDCFVVESDVSMEAWFPFALAVVRAVTLEEWNHTLI